MYNTYIQTKRQIAHIWTKHIYDEVATKASQSLVAIEQACCV